MDMDDLLGVSSALDVPIRLSTFPTTTDTEARPRTMSLRQIAAMVQKTTVSQATAEGRNHPLLKLAVFAGPRCAETISDVTGVEIDHDDGDIGPDEALAALRAAGVAALIYTTRKDSPGGKRRWRALLPLRRGYPASHRRPYAMAALKLLGVENDNAGVSTAEGSAFYYAGVTGKPRFVETCDGAFLDDVVSIGVETSDPDSGDDETDELDAILEAAHRRRDFSEAVETGRLQSALAAIPLETMPAGSIRPTVINVGFALNWGSGSGEDGLEIWRQFANRSQWYTDQIERGRSPEGIARRQARTWYRMRENRSRMVTLSTIFYEAELHGWSRGAVALSEHDALLADDEPDMDDLLAPTTAVVPDPGKNPDDNWQRLLAVTDEGDVKKTLHNIQTVIANDTRLYGRLGYNLLLQAVVFVREPAKLRKKERDGKPVLQLDGAIWRLDEPQHFINGKRWVDDHENTLRRILEAPKTQGGYALSSIPDRDMRAATRNVAVASTFHPIRDRLRSMTWDGTPRAERLFIDYLGCPDDEYHRSAARLFLLGAVARAFCPGHKFDFVPILEGAQGAGKSTFIRILGLDWAGELAVDFRDTNKVIEAMQGKWILEIPELQAFSKAETTLIKAAVSRTHDSARLAWDRHPRDYPRQCVMIGSTNEEDYLRDTTGARRFWPIHCKVDAIDTDRLRQEIEQIWAEVVVWFDQMRARQPKGDLPLYMRDPRATSAAKLLQESRRSETPEELLADEIRAALDEPEATDIDGNETAREWTCVTEVWVDLLGRDRKALENHITVRLIGKALRMAGWETCGTKKHPKYRAVRGYKKAG